MASKEPPTNQVASDDVMVATIDDSGSQRKLSANRDAYARYLHARKSVLPAVPEVTVEYENLRYEVPLPDAHHVEADTGVPSVTSLLWDLVTCKPARKLVHRNSHASQNTPPNTRRLTVLGGNTGSLRPSTMTLLLAPPGHGKTSFLKALTQQLKVSRGEKYEGTIKYSGLTAKEAEERGIFVPRLVNLAPQREDESFFAELTVSETLNFSAAAFRAPPTPDMAPESGAVLASELSETVKMLRLEECTSTYIGNETLRGISGGQKKRVAIAESLLSGARFLALDEVTTGLDAAVAFELLCNLREWARVSGGTIVAALLQPTPEMVELFDEVILMRDGSELYHGPVASLPAFLSRNGWITPTANEADIADWLVEWLTDPKKMAVKQHRRVTKLLAAYPELRGQLAAEASDADGSSPLRASPLPSSASSSASSSDDEGEEAEAGGEKKGEEKGEEAIQSHTSEARAAPSELQMLKENPNLRACLMQPVTATAGLVAAWHDWNKPATSREVKELSLESEYARKQYGSQYARSLLTLCWLIFGRQTKLVFRNRLLLFSLPIAGVITALILGSLFWKLGVEDFDNKLGCIFYMLVHLGFQGNAEIASIMAMRPVLYRQSAARMYPAALYPTAHIIWAMPRALLEAILFVSTLYFMTGFSNDASRFFLFLFLIFVGALATSAWLRLVGFTAKTAELAAGLGMPIASMQVIFGGFLLTREQVPKWLLGAYWASPFSWVFRALVRSETNDEAYSIRPPPGTTTLGDQYMLAYEMQTEQYWIGAAIGFCLAFFVLGIVLTGLGVTYIRHDNVIGSSRAATSDDDDVPVSGSPLPSPDIAAFSASSTLPFEPASISFKDITYTVDLPRSMGGGQRTLLRGVSGYANPGSVTFLMGASGAGKTTLLDAISGRKNTGRLSGEILVNGYPVGSKLAKLSCYVEQQDIISPYLTVTEALEFSATLRLPPSVKAPARKEFIDEIITVLELNDVAHRLVGRPTTGGLSPSQLKRLSIGIELCSNASIIFLDEPTSGLDSRNAMLTMRAIRNLATTLGRTIVTTIHQPSTEIFYMCDTLLMLQTGGYEVFCGPIGHHAHKLLRHFHSIEGIPECPIGANPSTYALEVLAHHPQSQEQLESSVAVPVNDAHTIDWVGTYRNAPLYKQALDSIHSQKAAAPTGTLATLQDQKRSTLADFAAILKRTNIIYNRNIPYTFGRIITFLFLGLVFGMLYYDSGSGNTYGAVRSKISVIFLSVSFGGVLFYTMPMAPLSSERALVYREKSGQLYPILSYGLCVLLVEIPWVILTSVIHVAIMYFMVGFIADAGVFFHYVLVFCEVGILFTIFGVWFAWLFPSAEIAQIWGGAFVGIFFIFAGLLAPAPSIGPQWYWLYRCDPVAYAMAAVVSPQFHCSGGVAAGCPALTVPTAAGYITAVISDYVESYFGIYYSERWPNVGWLALFIAVLAIFALLSLRYVSWIRR